LCPACGQQGEIDLRKVVRPASFPIDGLYDALKCTFGPCRGDGPPPTMLGLAPVPFDYRKATAADER